MVVSIINGTLKFKTNGNCDVVLLDTMIEEKLNISNLLKGIIVLFVPGSTGGLMTIEYEPGLIKDFKIFIEKIISENDRYFHDDRWGDGNGHSHLRSSIIGPSLVIPFNDRKMSLGKWQQAVFLDFDSQPRDRTLDFQIIGE
jgi:secondary thiamine-phosphate synthase enzyme